MTATHIPDNTLGDLKAAARALDALPNTVILAHDHKLDIACLSSLLGATIRLLELDLANDRLDEAKRLIAAANQAFMEGSLSRYKELHDQASQLVASIEGTVF